MTQIVPIDIDVYTGMHLLHAFHSVAEETRYIVQSSYWIPAKMTDNLLTIVSATVF